MWTPRIPRHYLSATISDEALGLTGNLCAAEDAELEGADTASYPRSFALALGEPDASNLRVAMVQPGPARS